ncbi:MAG: GNAT family N-acetyltransferase [Candidatus Pristimantibacillus sp.]
MTKACNAFINHAFNDLSLAKVEIGTATNNSKSRAIPERLGFTQEGVIETTNCFKINTLTELYTVLLKKNGYMAMSVERDTITPRQPANSLSRLPVKRI